MKSRACKMIGSAIGVAALVSGGATVAFATPVSDVQPSVAEVPSQDGTVSASAAVRSSAVEGEFTFDQAVVSSNATIAGVFAKAASTLCASVPDYAVRCACGNVIVVSGGEESVQASVADLVEAEGSSTYIMGCACASNVAGGGAAVNAEVQGVALATLLGLVA